MTFRAFRFLAAMSLLVCLAHVSALPAGEGTTVTVTLQPQVSVAAGIVSLRDIASLTGGTPRQREQIGGLDVGRLADDVETLTLSKAQVDLRLRLAAIDVPWLVRGPATVTAARVTARGLQSLVLDMIRAAYAESFHVKEKDIDVQLTYPLPAVLVREYPLQITELEPDLDGPARLGRCSVRLRGLREGALVRVVQVQVEVRRFQSVGVLKVPVRAGEPIDDNQLVWERHAVVRPDDMLAEDELVDRVAATSLPSGTWLQRRHVRRPTVQTSPDVRARDQVRVVAARGALTVALSGGVALESGRVGDSIRVRNPSSGQILTARIRSSKEVQVVY